MLSDADHWEQDLKKMPGLVKQVAQQHKQAIINRDMRGAVEEYYY
ncbi:MAG: hypothetical protein ACSLEM_01680 [Candidatus Malihini olakiniferum]